MPAGLSRAFPSGSELPGGDLDASELGAAGPVLVVSPHPDDEALGCGGLLATLTAADHAVWALLVSDGAASHPRSRRFDASARRALRDAEWHEGMRLLGVGSARLLRLDLADGAVPTRTDAVGFAAAASRIVGVLDRIRPATVLAPWRRDPHPDHRASHALVASALQADAGAIRCLEYLVWTAERAGPEDWPSPADAVHAWQFHLTPQARQAKRAAIAAHRSQLGCVIDDDPDGFSLDPAMLERATARTEWFLEGRSVQ